MAKRLYFISVLSIVLSIKEEDFQKKNWIVVLWLMGRLFSDTHNSIRDLFADVRACLFTPIYLNVRCKRILR